jgi:hypothetical protein
MAGSKKKNQHYVPRFLLRKFSSDGKSVSLIVLAKGVKVSGAPLANQCSRDYFYGRDSVLEDAFGAWEAEIANTVRRLDVASLQSLPPQALYQLRQYVHYQQLRTEGAAKSVDSMVGGVANAVFKEAPPGALPGSNEVRLRLKAPQRLALYSAATSTPMLLDLEVKFLVRSEPPGFITSDDPVIRANQWAENHPKFSTYRGLTGLGLKGIQMFLPLSPQVCVAVLDPATYRCGSVQSRVRHVSAEDVESLNRLQTQHAISCIYYSPEWSPGVEPIAMRDLKASAPPREWSTELGPKLPQPDGTIRQLVMSVAPDIRINGRFAFAETIDDDPYEGYDRVILPIRSEEMLRFTEYYRKRVEERHRSPGPANREKGRRRRENSK